MRVVGYLSIDARPIQNPQNLGSEGFFMPTYFVLYFDNLCCNYCCLNDSITGLRKTERSTYVPATSDSTDPVNAPASGTHSVMFQLNSNT